MDPSSGSIYIDPRNKQDFRFKKFKPRRKEKGNVSVKRGDQRHLTGWISCADPSSDGCRLAGEVDSLPSSSGMPTWRHLPCPTSTFFFAFFVVTFSATTIPFAAMEGVLINF